MRTFAVLGLLGALASAVAIVLKREDVNGQHKKPPSPPDCALLCFLDLQTASGCPTGNDTCLCPYWTGAAEDATTSCIRNHCSVVQQLSTRHYQETVCGTKAKDEGNATRVTAWVLFSFAIFAVSFRFVARLILLQGTGLWWDDWTILVVAILSMPLMGMVDGMTREGLGKQTSNLSPWNITMILYHLWIEQFFYIATVMGTKISILLLFLRIFPDSCSTFFRRASWILICICFASIITFSFVNLFSCQPISYTWSQWDRRHQGRCIHLVAYTFVTAALNTVLDGAVVILPIPKLIALDMPLGKKLWACVMFFFGLFAMACTIVRATFLPSTKAASDPMFRYNKIAFWSSIECNVGIICACLPSMAGPIKRLWKRISTNKSSKRGVVRGDRASMPIDGVSSSEFNSRPPMEVEFPALASVAGPDGGSRPPSYETAPGQTAIGLQDREPSESRSSGSQRSLHKQHVILTSQAHA